MFCPRCGQEQVSEETRFCSRCGFPLGLVAQVLGYGGSLPQLAEIYNKPKGWFTRSNGWKLGLAWFLILTFLFTPIFAIMGGDEIVAFTAVLGFMGGLLIILFSFMFLKKEPQTWDAEQLAPSQTARDYNALHGNASQNVLPPQQSVPTSAYVPPMNSWKAPDTGDLARPGSVTEGTTKLLNKDE
ncbi:MAG TPA: zinc ribbon domain-containing protein [Pyrinomonadaceae bacterium]|nr:zinc ribbon domain-containing protein [Pyrinomonadaceae bacterium]